MRRIWEMNVRIMPLRLVPLDKCRIKTFLHVGHIFRLVPFRASLPVTILVMFRKSYVMLELREYLPPNAGIRS